MSKKDYTLIAKALSSIRTRMWNELTTAVVDDTAREIAHALAADNAAFDFSRFMSAVTNGKV